ncbi:unnamed protein product [Bursaphelenchus okinawaensis]|uniref:G_PROTEIN_RECEP_F1_2 domain-containing protein n=1 Tax=Bursaphelenchus okinawaensis TaxID=465554 RepID=A0A811LF32_9BILA|nr:unnamed protein product [Bursaphelenchus okinawaensis]CAG9121983.1 unnamed protein product [Bursaphelenchus okinawaensis]
MNYTQEDLEQLHNALISLQIIVSIPVLSVCLYISYKLYKLATINANLKLIVIITTLSYTVAITEHALLASVPQQVYSVKEGQYFNALLYYTAALGINYLCFIFSFKYPVIAIERTVAYRRVKTYDSEGNVFGLKLIKNLSFLSIVLLIIKIVLIWKTTHGEDIDERLQKTLNVFHHVPGFLFDVIIGTLGMIHCVFTLNSLMSKVKNQYCCSLTESYEIRQTKCTLQWVKKMLCAFIGLCIIVFPFTIVLFYLYMYRGYDTDKMEIQIIIQILSILVDGYTFITTMMMYCEFPHLKKAIIYDFPCVFPTVSPNHLSKEAETETYFNNFEELMNAKYKKRKG